MKFDIKIFSLQLLIFVLFFASKKAIAQMEFVQNKGQWEERITYKGDFANGAFFLEQKGFTVVMHKSEDLVSRAKYIHSKDRSFYNKEKDTAVVHSHAYKVQFLGANLPTILPDKALPTYNNYFIGNDNKKWAGDCKIYNAITYQNIYPNIDVRYYSTQGKLKYDFIVKPGGNPANIALRYDGVNKLSIANKELVITTSVGEARELAPYSYQTNVGGRRDVSTKYVVKNNVVTFDVANYDAAATLVIDPQLVFVSFTRSTADNFGFTATPGLDGTFFSGGIVFGTGFPVTTGAYQTTYGAGVTDIAIFKFSANGTLRQYATYIGGSGTEQPHSIIADAQGNLVIAGMSSSPNYPLLTNIPATGTGVDIIITKLNAAGNALLGSTKIGGSNDDGINVGVLQKNYGDDARSEVILDTNNNVVLASCTKSTNFPVVNALQPAYGGGTQDGVILKLNANLSNLIFSTYFGGSGADACIVAAISPLTNILLIGGATNSNNLLGNTANTIAPNAQGGVDGFITQITANGSAFLKTTYIGTTGEDVVYGVKFDRFGFPYATGTTTGNWPISTNVLYSVIGAKQFIVKMQPNLSAYVYSTTFGTNAATPNISPTAFLVDRCENVYVSGWGGDVNGGYPNSGTSGLPQVNPIVSVPPLPSPDGSDFYFFVLKKNAESQLFGSHFGQNGGAGDHVDGGTSRFDENGIIYQAVCANCLAFGPANFPTFPPASSPNAPWSSINPSNNCNLAAVKINMDFAGITNTIQSSILGVLNDTLGCSPVLVSFIDTLQKGVKYFWNFDVVNFPNVTDTITLVANASHLYNSVGIYKVRLISEDSSTCNIRDTAFINIEIADRVVTPRFTYQKIGGCNSTTYEFTNTSFPSDATVFNAKSFVWDWGDGSPKDTTNKTPVRIHTFPGPGTYFVKLTVIDDRFCNTPITDTQMVNIITNVKAIPAALLGGCSPYAPTFQNNSLNGVTYEWEFLNATTGNIIGTSTDFQPIFTFVNEGIYKYRLLARNAVTCNITDTSAYFSFSVLKSPIANFDWNPKPIEAEELVKFINLSSFASAFFWNFGDTSTSILFEPTHIYQKKGSYNVTLTAFNTSVCTASITLPVIVVASQLLDVPNAFTPGKFGTNSVVYVRGFGIGKMIWRIYNRWGELVFTSTDKKVGWDGFYKGTLQPMDVYTYTLDVEFVDGEKLKKTGDISLLR